MNTDTHDTDSVPSTGQQRILAVLKDNQELLDKALDHKDGYPEEVTDEIASRWGSEHVPESCPVYVSTIKSRNVEELKEYSENHSNERQTDTESVTELSSPELPELSELQLTSDKDRCKAIIQRNEEFLEQAARDELDIAAVQQAVTDEWGVLYSPTEDTVRDAVSQLRLNDELPRDGIDLQDVDKVQKIVYMCELCRDFEAKTQTEIQDHLGNTDDAVHDGWTASDFQPVSIRCEPIEETHDVLESEAFQEEVGRDYDLLRALYYNPDVRQRDIADMVGMSQSGLSQKLSGFGWSWETCQDDIEHLLETWDESDEMSIEKGQVKYVGPSTGLDTTSGRSTQTIKDRASKEGNISITLTEVEARTFLTEKNETPVREKILKELL